MSEDLPPQLDRRKIRIGLAMISVVVIAALIGVAVVEEPAGKALMFAIAAVGFLRLFLLTRSLRKPPPAG